MKTLKWIVCSGAVLLCFAATGSADDGGLPTRFSSEFRPLPEVPPVPVAISDVPARLPATTESGVAMTDRLAELEAEQEALRAEIQWLRENPTRLPAAKATTVSLSNNLIVPETPSADEEYFTIDELKKEMKKLAWTKGDFSIVPYGSLWGSGIYATERVYPGPYTLWVYSPDVQGEDTFVIDTRRTRVGMDIGGPRIPFFCDAKSGGKIEIDFHGAFVVENKPGVLLRHAYGEVKNENFRMLAGQTWDVISPLYPGTLSYSVGWAGGNIGYRRAQVRYERYLAFSDTFLFTAQGSINQNIVNDFSSVAGASPEPSGWPILEARTAVTLGCRNQRKKPVTIGVSGHFGEQGADFTTTGPAPYFLPPDDDYRVRTWSLNVDVYAPITERFGFEGEFFTGENLSTFLGGVVQGVNIYTRTPIRASGGWFDFWYDWTPRLHSHVGYGVDDPVNADLTSGRTYNEFVFVNGVFDITKQLQVGMEVSHWKTNYIGQRPGDSAQIEFTGKYGF